MKPGIDLVALGLRTVKDLMNSPQKVWNQNIIWKVFSSDTSVRILSTHIPQEEFQDHFKWIGSKSENLRVKDAYVHLLMNKGTLGAVQDDSRFWNKLALGF